MYFIQNFKIFSSPLGAMKNSPAEKCLNSTLHTNTRTYTHNIDKKIKKVKKWHLRYIRNYIKNAYFLPWGNYCNVLQEYGIRFTRNVCSVRRGHASWEIKNYIHRTLLARLLLESIRSLPLHLSQLDTQTKVCDFFIIKERIWSDINSGLCKIHMCWARQSLYMLFKARYRQFPGKSHLTLEPYWIHYVLVMVW